MSRENAAKPSMLSSRHTSQRNAEISDLNSNQQMVLEKLESLNDVQLVNIYGPSGVGKTHLGWALARGRESWSYRPWVPTTPVEVDNIVIDNVTPERVASRRVRELVNFDDVDLAVALSRKSVPEIHNAIELPPYTNE